MTCMTVSRHASLILAALAVATATACSNSSGTAPLPAATATTGYETSTAVAAQSLTRTDVAAACEATLKQTMTAEGLTYDSLDVATNAVPADGIVEGLFKGPLEATLHNDEFSGTFSFTCLTDGVNTQVGEFYFPPENFKSAPPASRAAPAPQHPQQGQQPIPPVDPNRIDPQNNGAGWTARDDNLGILYHNRQDWVFLEAPGAVMPGGRIYNADGGNYCSTGFITSQGDRVFIVTAGHCGAVGHRFYITDPSGNRLTIGEMVESYVEGNDVHIEGADIGLIEIYDEAKPYVDSALPMNEKLQGWLTPQEAQRRNMAICRLGSTTGYSCGTFVSIEPAGQFYYRNITDRGDSGGAIFAYDQSGVWALGVSSRVSDYNKTLAGGMEIAGAMQYWGLTLHG